MKKLFLGVIVIIFTSVIVISCEKETNTTCKTCESQDFKTLNFKLANQNFAVKAYGGKNFIYYSGILESSNQISFLNNNNNESKISNENFNAIAVYFNEKLENDTSVSLDDNNILAYATYTIENGKNYRVRIFKKNVDNFEELNRSFKTTEVSSNDINDISKLFFTKKSNVLFLTKTDLLKIDEKQNLNELRMWLEIELSNKGAAVFYDCDKPCNQTNGPIYCAIESGILGPDYWCKTVCSGKMIASNIIKSGNKDYDFIAIFDELYNFRDNYLKVNDGGQKIIDEYYFLSDRFPVEKMSMEQQVQTFNLIVSDVIPSINSIISKPNSDEKLIDNEQKEKLINYLKMVKPLFNNAESKEKINHLIEMVNHFSNKSNSYITTHLNDF